MGVTRLVVTGVKQGVKYAPAITAVVKEARGPVTDYAKARLEASRQRRLAVTKAASLEGGTVLSVVHGEQQVWVVFSGDEPVAQHPNTGLALAQLVEHADLSRRRPPADFPNAKERASAAKHRVAGAVRRRKPKDPSAGSVADPDPELLGEGVGELDELRPADRGAAQAREAERGDEPGA